MFSPRCVTRLLTRTNISTSVSKILRPTTTRVVRPQLPQHSQYSTQPPQMAATVDAVKNTIAENFGGESHSLAAPEHQFALDDVPDQSGKVAVVTGGSEGIGFGCVYTLLGKNISKVFVLSMSEDVVDAAKDTVAKEIGPDAARRIVWLQIDLSDWPGVAKIAEQISEQTDRIDILINCAARGVMTYQLTDYNVDQHMAVNFMGHVVLTSHLLPVLKKTASNGNTVRIVCFGSNAHQGTPSDTKFASLDELNQDLGPNGQYGRSKLAQMLYARYLSTHLTSSNPNILANSVHPGFVSTKASKKDIHEAFPVGGYAISTLMEPFKKDQFQGAVSALFCATKTEKSGQYVCPPAIPEQGSKLYNEKGLEEQLMKLTKEIVTEKTKSQSVDKGCPMSFY